MWCCSGGSVRCAGVTSSISGVFSAPGSYVSLGSVDVGPLTINDTAIINGTAFGLSGAAPSAERALKLAATQSIQITGGIGDVSDCTIATPRLSVDYLRTDGLLTLNGVTTVLDNSGSGDVMVTGGCTFIGDVSITYVSAALIDCF